jgi:hypothetical protein
MWIFWLFWIETILFVGYVLWTLQAQTAGRPLAWYQWANLVVYGAALIYGSYGFIRFLRRRLAPRK